MCAVRRIKKEGASERSEALFDVAPLYESG